MPCCGLFRSKNSRQLDHEKPTPLARGINGPVSGQPLGGKSTPPITLQETPPPYAGVVAPYNNPQFAQIPGNSPPLAPEIQPFHPQQAFQSPNPYQSQIPYQSQNPYQSPNPYPPPQTYPQTHQPHMQMYQPQAYQHPDPPIEPVTRRFSFRQNATVGIDHYAALRHFDTVFLIDDSGSMMGPNWRQTSAALEAIVPICTAHDADGVDIYFLNSPRAHTHIRSSAEVLEIFSAVRPSGATPTGRRLGEILELYIQTFRADRSIKPLNIIVITDGEPTDPAKLKRSIIDCAKNLDALGARDRQVGVQFFQVGNDEAATESLEELDNSLVEEENVRDMVDTISWRNMNEGKGLSADGILKAVMGAVDKRLDRTQRAI